MKVARERADLDAIYSSGLRVTNCVPAVPSILPNAVIEGTWDVEARVAAILGSVDFLARLGPDCVLCLTGAQGGYAPSKARRLVIEGLKRIAEVASYMDVPLGLEPIHTSQREQLSLITTIPETLDLLDEADLPQVGIMVDLWHLGDTPEIERHLTENVERITGVHVAERLPGRDDRGLPGARCAELMRVLADAGWQGAWDVEIFGDAELDDSLWSLDVDEAATRAYAAVSASIA